MRSIVLSVLLFYRAAVSPLLPATCRFTPTCSSYAQEAIATQGLAKGLWLAVRRLLRCRPGGGYGFDPVPGPRCGEARKGSLVDG